MTRFAPRYLRLQNLVIVSLQRIGSRASVIAAKAAERQEAERLQAAVP
ncbi:hypothetical protein JQ628_25015 [Bradyrhizobium lablabi]|nr:hypothetical protein [Bradyrhizobium lablabi]MBR1124807.1 hypothetical protein [Bradyrhizobium lablabi]